MLNIIIAAVSAVIVFGILVITILLYRRMSRRGKLAAAKLFLKRDDAFKAITAIAFSGIFFLSGRVISLLASLGIVNEKVIYNVRYPLDSVAILLIAYSYYKFYKLLASETYTFK